MSFRRMVGLFCFAILLCLALAPRTHAATTVQDNFNNNTLDTTLWKLRKTGGVTAKEQNGRLEVFTNGPTGLLSGAGLEVKLWGANWAKDFTLSIDYNLTISAPSGNRSAGLGFALGFAGSNQNNFTGLIVGIERDRTAIRVGWALIQNGVPINGGEKVITQTSGNLKLTWDKSEDKLTIRGGGKTIRVNNLWANYGAQYGNRPLVIGIGGGTVGGNMNISGSKARLDNFKFVGTKRNR